MFGSAINSALRSLEANQLGLAIASNNIANAQTPGYTRQRLVVAPAMDFGASIGSGVEVVGTEALRDRLIELRLAQETSSHAQDEFTYRGLSDVETMFNETGDTGLLPLLSDFFNSFQALSAEPTSLNRRQEVLSKAANMASFLNSRGDSLAELRTRFDRALAGDIPRINTLLDQIASMTARIAEQEVRAPAHELRDQRAVLVQQLASIVEVHEVESAGNYQLSIGNNRAVVYNSAALDLTAAVDSAGYTAILLGNQDITGELRGGAVGAYLQLRDQMLPGYIGALDQIAFELAGQVNAIHSAGYDLDGNTGNVFFTPPAAVAGAARTIAVDAATAADPRRVAASGQPGGTSNEAAIQIGNLLSVSVFSGGSITGQYSSLIYAIGSDTANAEFGMRQHQALVQQLENRRQEVSGVSIDEEAVKILQFQRAFEASARVIRAVDELLQTTLAMGR